MFLISDYDLEEGHEATNDDDKFSLVFFFPFSFEVLEDRLLVRKDLNS